MKKLGVTCFLCILLIFSGSSVLAIPGQEPINPQQNEECQENEDTVCESGGE